jgi:hypothetical protein
MTIWLPLADSFLSCPDYEAIAAHFLEGMAVTPFSSSDTNYFCQFSLILLSSFSVLCFKILVIELF